MKDVIVHFLYNNIPRYVKEDYPNFHELIKEYYQLINDIMLDDVLEIRANASLTETNTEYLEKYIQEKGFKFYDRIKDKKQFALMMNDLISYRGSEQAVKYVMRSLFGDDIIIEYPRDKLLIPSYTEYAEEYYVYTTASSLDTVKFNEFLERSESASANIKGKDSNTQTLIESVEVINDKILKIGILLPQFDFHIGEKVLISIDDIEIEERLYIIPKIIINEYGQSYKQNDVITITNTIMEGEYKIKTLYRDSINDIEIDIDVNEGDYIDTRSDDGGYGFVAKIEDGNPIIYNKGRRYCHPPKFRINGEYTTGIIAIDSNIGGVDTVSYIKPFLIDKITNHEITIQSETGIGFIGSLEFHSIFNHKKYNNERSTLNKNSYLVDSEKYQMYSYIIKTDIDEDEFMNIVREYLGRSGYAFFKEDKR